MPKREELTGAVLAAIRESLEMKGVSDVDPAPETPVDRSLGLDSLDWAAVVVRLEEALGIDPFEQGVERELKTVGDIVDVYEAALAARRR